MSERRQSLIGLCIIIFNRILWVDKKTMGDCVDTCGTSGLISRCPTLHLRRNKLYFFFSFSQKKLVKDSERVPIGCRNTKKSAPLLIGRSSRFRVVTQLWVPPSLLTAVPESLRQPASDRAPGRGRRDEVDSDFSFFPLNENEASCASVELLRGSSSDTRTRVWLFSVREETLRRVSGDFRIYWREV